MSSRVLRSWPEFLALAGIVALAATLVLKGASALAGGAAALDTDKLTTLVQQDCGSCHGLTLKGGLGKPLTPEHLAQWDRDQIAAIILEGVPLTPMPPWRPLLSEAEAIWIADRLKEGSLQ